jgi:hypothetical protein
MVAGELKCLGSLQHLKARFGTGFYLSIKMKPTTDLPHLLDAIGNEAKAAQVYDDLQMDVLAQYASSVSVWVKAGASLGHLFSWMESADVKVLVDDYSVNQPSLEQVFLGFARQAEEIRRAEAEAEAAQNGKVSPKKTTTPPATPPTQAMEISIV